MTDYQTPCQTSETPDDWFISKDGRQYSDDDFLTDEDRLEILETVAELDIIGDERLAYIEGAQDALEAERKRDALISRRKAKDACFVSCYFRGHCLDIAFKQRPANGTWGGYFEEELRVLYDELDKRKNKE